ncbi:MAG: helix-turn-helix transcriptional regulator [bacterium]
MNAAERDAFFDEVVSAVNDGKMTWGEAVRALRVEVTGLNQAAFARAVKISERTLRQLELDAGNPTLETLNAVLRPFGLKLGLRR